MKSEKGVDLLLSVARQFHNKNKEPKIIVIGNGSAEYIARLRALEPTVLYMGKIPNHKLLKYYNQARILFIPSRTEGGPVVALESMLCGTPVFARPIGFIPNIVEDGYNGYIIHEDRADAIAKRIRVILNQATPEVSLRARDSLLSSIIMKPEDRWKELIQNIGKRSN